MVGQESKEERVSSKLASTLIRGVLLPGGDEAARRLELVPGPLAQMDARRAHLPSPGKSAFIVAALLQPGVRPFALTHVGRRLRGGQAVPNFLPARARMGAWKALHVEVDDEPGETLLALPDRSPADLDTEPERDWEKPLLA